MPRLTMTVGLPGSGKSTWLRKYIADKPGTIIICRDDLRQSLAGGEYVFYGARDRWVGMVGVAVFLTNDDSCNPAVKIMHPDEHGTVIFPEAKELEHFDCESAEVLLFSHCVKMEEFYRIASECKHEHIEFDDDDMKCMDRGLNTRHMHYDLTLAVQDYLSERIVDESNSCHP